VAFVEAVELPEPEPHERDDDEDHETQAGEPSGAEQETTHTPRVAAGLS
jgi:hypothetical protein